MNRIIFTKGCRHQQHSCCRPFILARSTCAHLSLSLTFHPPFLYIYTHHTVSRTHTHYLFFFTPYTQAYIYLASLPNETRSRERETETTQKAYTFFYTLSLSLSLLGSWEIEYLVASAAAALARQDNGSLFFAGFVRRQNSVKGAESRKISGQ